MLLGSKNAIICSAGRGIGVSTSRREARRPLKSQAPTRCSAMRSKKEDHPCSARSYCSADMRPRC
jgi:hypothetical protein